MIPALILTAITLNTMVGAPVVATDPLFSGLSLKLSVSYVRRGLRTGSAPGAGTYA